MAAEVERGVGRRVIVTGAWWDFVDDIAIRLVGPLLLARPNVVRPVLRGWAKNRTGGGAEPP